MGKMLHRNDSASAESRADGGDGTGMQSEFHNSPLLLEAQSSFCWQLAGTARMEKLLETSWDWDMHTALLPPAGPQCWVLSLVRMKQVQQTQSRSSQNLKCCLKAPPTPPVFQVPLRTAETHRSQWWWIPNTFFSSSYREMGKTPLSATTAPLVHNPNLPAAAPASGRRRGPGWERLAGQQAALGPNTASLCCFGPSSLTFAVCFDTTAAFPEAEQVESPRSQAQSNVPESPRRLDRNPGMGSRGFSPRVSRNAK